MNQVRLREMCLTKHIVETE